MKKYLMLLVIIILFGFCTDENHIYNSKFKNGYTLNIVDSLVYYYKDSVYIGRIHDIQIIGSKILISDFFLKKVFVFSKDMNLIKVIGREGKAPAEYTYAPNIMYDNKYIWFFSGYVLD